MSHDPAHAPLPQSHTPDRGDLLTPAPAGDLAVPPASHRACALCHRSLAGRRSETITCGSRCRSALARLRRREDLVARIRRGEAALREAADALSSIKELAGLDATLELRTISGGAR
jgi:hypothetical protein